MNCSYCDTKYAKQPANEKVVDIEDLLDIITKNTYVEDIVLLTGGEPLLQIPVIDEIIHTVGNDITIETNGSIDLGKINYIGVEHICMDIKSPSSNPDLDWKKYGNQVFENLGYLGEEDDVKFVINSEEDWKWLVKNFFIYYDSSTGIQYYISHTENFPFNRLWEKFVKEVKLHQKNVRIQTQLHKVAFKNGQKEGKINKII